MLINFFQFNKEIDETINSDITIKLSENYMKYVYDDEQMIQYETEKKNAINEMKVKYNLYLVIVEIGLLIVYLGVVPLQKKSIIANIENQ